MYITFYGADLTDCICIITAYCAVPENIHTPPWKALEISGGWGFPKTKKFKEMLEVELEFPEGSGALIKKIPSVGRYGYFKYGTTHCM